MAALCVTSCTNESAAPVEEPATPLEGELAAAAREYGVPLELLKAISYVETGWHHAVPEEDGDVDELGRPVAFGVFALRGDNLTKGMAAAGVDFEATRTTTSANIAAAAARLAELAREQGVAGDDLMVWTPVIAQFAQVEDEEARGRYVEEVLLVLANGAKAVDEEGRTIAELAPKDGIELTPMVITPYVGGGDFAGAIWRPSPNYSSRTASVTMVVIHTCEGGYSGCWGWLKNSSSGVSAHYVVNESGSEVTQLVRESKKAWHVSANYDCSRAGNQQCSRNGMGVNNFAVGIEHGGFGSQTSWSTGLIETSARLTCDITKRHNIPRDKYHIIAHGQLQPWSRTDPGKHWPWDHYIDRVRAHCGDSGTTTTPPPTNPSSQIIVDSNQSRNDPALARIELAGTWTSSSAQAGYFGTGYWTANTAQTSQPATFWFYLPQAATRTIDAWWTTSSNRATGAPFIAFNASGTEVGRTVVNQQVNGGKWVALGTWSFSAGWNKVVLSRWATLNKVVIADAVRIR